MNKNKRFLFRLALALCPGLALAAGPADRGHECLIEPYQRVEIRSPVIGVIDAIPVERGAQVKAGQVLVQLDAGVDQAALASARLRAQSEGETKVAAARLDYARNKLRRRQELFEQNFITAHDRDEAAAEAKVAEAEMALAADNRRIAGQEQGRLEEVLKLRSLRAPFSGVVTDRLQNPGELAFTGEGAKPILKLARTHPLRVDLVLPVSLLGRVKLGRELEVVPEPPLKGSWKATVRIVDSVVDSASGSFGVRLELPNPRGDIPAGVKCRVQLD